VEDGFAYLALGVAIVLLSAGQIAQKVVARQIFASDDTRSLLRRAITSAAAWMTVFFLGCGTLFWLLALTRIEVSAAYPILGLSFVLTTLFAKLILGETVSAYRWFGVALITLGATLMAAAS
jgi:drug/metabolite transporter (DMT)-like permease